MLHRLRPARSAAALLAVVLAAACGGPSATQTANTAASAYAPEKGTSGGTLVWSDWQQVADLNVLNNTARTTQQVASGSIWASLWQFDSQSNPYPDLVSEVPTVDNKLVKAIDSKHVDVTIKLKPGLKWSDGTPLTAEDVKFTVDAICDPDTGAASQTGFDHITSQEVKSPTELVWHFGPNKSGTCGLSSDIESGIYAPYLLLGTPVVSKAALSGVKHADWSTADYFNKKPTPTNGPYMVQDFVPGPAAQVVMVPNPHYAEGRDGSRYFGHKPYLERIVYKVYGDKASQIAGLKAGDTDLGVDLIAKDLPALTAITNNTTQHATGLLNEFLVLNLANNTTGCDAQQFAATCGTATVFKGDKALRQAVDLAIDKDLMNQQLVGGIGKTMNGPFVAALSPYYDPATAAFKRDLAKANSLLDADGWTKGADGLRSKNGRKLAWVISTTTGNPQRAAEEELLISNWKEIGATVTSKNFSAGTFFNSFKGGGTNATGQFDMSLYANNWSPDPDSWGTTVTVDQIPSAANGSGANWGRNDDVKLSDLFRRGAAVVDIAERTKIYRQAADEWRDYVPQISLYERPDVFSHDAAFGNFVPAVNSCVSSCNAADWYRKGKA